MKDISTIPTLAQPAARLTLPVLLAQPAADAVRELLAEAAAANTTRSYASALRYWVGWHAARYSLELDLPVPVLQFVVDHMARRSAEGELAWELPPAVDQALVAAGLKAKLGPWTLATVHHRVAVLSTAHRLKQLPNPCEQPASRTVLSRDPGRGETASARKNTAITLPELEAMLADLRRLAGRPARSRPALLRFRQRRPPAQRNRRGGLARPAPNRSAGVYLPPRAQEDPARRRRPASWCSDGRAWPGWMEILVGTAYVRASSPRPAVRAWRCRRSWG
jgi:hypothetical protein